MKKIKPITFLKDKVSGVKLPLSVVRKTLLSYLTITCLLAACKKSEPISGSSSRPESLAVANAEAAAEDVFFELSIIPDTQFYTAQRGGSTVGMFQSQIDWIIANYVGRNIQYVAHMGDITDQSSVGDSHAQQWLNAKNVLYDLETVAGLPDGIPYGLAVGNHEQYNPGFPSNPWGYTFYIGSPSKYNDASYFGTSHFAGRSYYGGGSYSDGLAGNDNDNHWDKFTYGGQSFIVVYIEYNDEASTKGGIDNAALDWAYNVLTANPNSKAIVVSHSILNPTASSTATTNANGMEGFSAQGSRIYEKLKHTSNLFLMLCGHEAARSGEGFRMDTFDGRTVYTYLTDYSKRQWDRSQSISETDPANTSTKPWGYGLMRYMRFNLTKRTIHVRTFTPYRGSSIPTSAYYDDDGDSNFWTPLFHKATSCDFSLNNGRSELMLYRGAGGQGIWTNANSAANQIFGTGGSNDIPAWGDFDADGLSEVIIWNKVTANWYRDGYAVTLYGDANALPVPADYDGDGKTDLATWNPANATWKIDSQPQVTTAFGMSSHIPVPADYNGDRSTDIAVFNPATGSWAIRYSPTTTTTNFSLGQAGDIPVPADYNGDGKAEVAVFRPSTGQWFTHGTSAAFATLGQAGDIPIPGDYNFVNGYGDGKYEAAVYRPSNNTIYYSNGTASQVVCVSGDKPINLPYHIRKFFFP